MLAWEEDDIFGTPVDGAGSRFCRFGYATHLLGMSASARGRTFDHHNSVIVPAMEHEQIRFWFNSKGLPVAYMVWANLSKEVEQRIFATSRMDLHLSEWDEGPSTWIIDVVARGCLRAVLNDARDSLFGDQQTVRYLRRSRATIKILQWSRESRSAFFSEKSQRPAYCGCGRIQRDDCALHGQLHPGIHARS